MIALEKGRYRVRPVADTADMDAVMALRHARFGAQGALRDRFDRTAAHILVEDRARKVVVGSFRMARYAGAELCQSYAAQFYDLAALAAYAGPMLELGRFCIAPDHPDPDIARIAWAALTAYVDRTGVELLFGCASFSGTDPAPYADALALLRARHLAPARWAPQVKAPDVIRFGTRDGPDPDLARANAGLPPLLRSYLMMGGWVSDHAVVDAGMDTLHVFTGVEIALIPPARKRLLRALV